MGIVREQPVAMMFGKPLTLTVIENSDFRTYKELREWLNGTTVNAEQNQFGTYGRSQRMRYYDQFTADMQIIKLEHTGAAVAGQIGYKEVMEVNFINAYPISIGAINLDSNATDTFTTFQIDFTYESYSVNYGLDGVRSVSQALSSFVAG